MRSVCWDDNRGLVLVGTQGSEIYEITTENQSVLLLSEGHCADELWGLAAHPSDPDLFVTGGDDRTVRVWHARERRLVRRSSVGSMTRAVAWSPDGAFLGCGLGGSVGRGRQKKDGAMMVLNSDLTIAHETRDSREWISDAKFSPDGSTFAIGSHDNKIYLYDVGKGFSLKGKCEKHNSYITHLDFSADSDFLQSNCGGFELLFYKVVDGGHINSPSTLKDVEWASQTCPLGWPVQGIWPDYSDGTYYNAVARSHDQQLLATADEGGNVKLFNFPCVNKEAGYVSGRGHSSHVTNVRFLVGDQYLVSVGGSDRAVCQWRVVTSGLKGN